MTIKAILFDMDGVLIDAREWHYEALNRALSLFGCPISRLDHLQTFDGLPTLKKLELISLDGNLPKELHGFVNEMKQRYTMEIVYTECKPMFTHEYALAKLSESGYKIAVCSNSVRNSVTTMMKQAALEKYIQLMVSNEDVEKGKPDPEMYIQAMEFFVLKPSECLIVEDNENGIKAARASGGHLMKVDNVLDVNLPNIMTYIKQIEAEEG